MTVSKRLNNSSVSGAEVTIRLGGLGSCSCLSSGGVTGRSVNSLSGLWSSGKRGGRREYVFCAIELDLIVFGCSQNDCGKERCFMGSGSGKNENKFFNALFHIPRKSHVKIASKIARML